MMFVYNFVLSICSVRGRDKDNYFKGWCRFMILDFECKCVLGIDFVLIYLVKVKKIWIEEVGRSLWDCYLFEYELKMLEVKMIIICFLMIYLICGMVILVWICRV